MAGAKTDELSTEEAKARLRETAQQVGVHAWVKQHPYEAIAAAFAAGLVLATSRPMRTALVRLLIRAI